MKVYAAPEEITKPSLEALGVDGIENYQRETEEYLSAVQDWARKNGQPHELNGETVQVPYADGVAIYVVVKLSGRVSLLHIDTWDEWRDPMFEELATVKYIRNLIRGAKARAKLFAASGR